MFIDSVKIDIRGGNGGKGCQSFYRDKYARWGVPDGGRGGKGSDIIIRADRNLRTLMDFRYNKHFYGLNGAHGSGNNKKGKEASAVIIHVPCGTVIKDIRTDCILRDLDKDGEEVIAAYGGKGGSGNYRGNTTTSGSPGEEKKLLLDLKLIADAGVIGFPNAGKSTLISAISHASPQIAPYPFTTKSPVLGVVNKDDVPFVIADIPGLIEGASKGKGLGDRFLRHVERTKILVHLIDMSASEGRNPLEDYRVINKELKDYSSEVYRKPQIIAANKMDLEGAKLNLARFRKAVRKRVYPISALKREGLEELIEAIRKKL
ncbi:MAG: GTPase ObgE [Candidatus Omnitrophota bacterium]